MELKSEDITAGQSWSFTFSAVGTYSYVDDENKDNPAMHGTVTVQTGGGGGGPGNPPPGNPGPDAPAKATVSLANKAFSPRSVTISVGGTVTWTNNDGMPHNVTSTSGAFHSPTPQPGRDLQADLHQARDLPVHLHPPQWHERHGRRAQQVRHGAPAGPADHAGLPRSAGFAGATRRLPRVR